jgi:DNA-binding NarL/FixJ family response regulator
MEAVQEQSKYEREQRVNLTFICASRALVRESLAIILSSDPLIEVCGTAANTDEMLNSLNNQKVDSVVIDITYQGDIALGLKAAEAVVDVQPNCRSVLLADAITDELVLAAKRAGVSALVDRTRPVAELTDVTRNGHNGQNGHNHLSAFEVRSAQKRLRDNGVLKALELGETDRRILELLKEGCTDKEISEQIYLSPHTVRNRISRLLTVLGKSNRTQLAVMASQPNLQLAFPM